MGASSDRLITGGAGPDRAIPGASFAALADTMFRTVYNMRAELSRRVRAAVRGEAAKGHVNPWVPIAIGLVAGIASGLLGVGGGIVMVPLLATFAGFAQHRAHATSLAPIVP